MRNRDFPRRFAGSMVLVVFCALALSCGGSSNSALVGAWQGTTSQNAQLSFQVQAQKTNTSTPTIFCFGFNVTDSQFRSLATGCDGEALVFPVRGDSFSIDHRVNQVTVFRVTGRFVSTTSAIGEIVDLAGPAPINLTWSASKN